MTLWQPNLKIIPKALHRTFWDHKDGNQVNILKPENHDGPFWNTMWKPLIYYFLAVRCLSKENGIALVAVTKPECSQSLTLRNGLSQHLKIGRGTKENWQFLTGLIVKKISDSGRNRNLFLNGMTVNHVTMTGIFRAYQWNDLPHQNFLIIKINVVTFSNRKRLQWVRLVLKTIIGTPSDI